MRFLTIVILFVASFAAGDARAHEDYDGEFGHYNNRRPVFYNPYHYANPRQGIQAYEYVHPYHGMNPQRVYLWRGGRYLTPR